MAKKEIGGHYAHMNSTVSTVGLPGKGYRKIKIVHMGAGSGFAHSLSKDFMQMPDMPGGEIALVDIDAKRLDIMFHLIKALCQKFGKEKEWKITAYTDRRKALPGADYIVNSIEVSGVKCVRFDNDIPLQYGVSQCIGDTIGPGGLMKALRTVPVWMDILHDAEELCPNALVLNYTNPMNIMTLATLRYSKMKCVGLCHSVQGTSKLLAKRAGIPYEEMEWECAGINHLAWFTKLKHHGKDLYPLLIKKAIRDLKAGTNVDKDDNPDLVRKDMMVHFGAFITESSGHLSEYISLYRTSKKHRDEYCRPGYDGEEGFYADGYPKWRRDADKIRTEMYTGKRELGGARGHEYASWIVEAIEKNSPFRMYGNVLNTSLDGAGPLISNLPHDGCVEVACLIDRNGVQPLRYGALPTPMAAICAADMYMFEQAAQAAVNRSIEQAIQALYLDPLTSAVCTPKEIREMFLKLYKAEKKFLPNFK